MAEPPAAPSPFFEANLPRLLRAARRGPLLDVACGRGRHALAAASRGAAVIGLDRNPAALAQLSRAAGRLPLRLVRTDLETPHGLPLAAARCGAVLVFRFLFRPLAPALARALLPGGVLLYETFTQEQRNLGHGPSNPAFLLEPGELPELFPELVVEEYQELRSEGPRPEFLARLRAVRPAA